MRAQWICDLTANVVGNKIRNVKQAAEKPFWEGNLAARTLYLESLLASDIVSRLHGETLVWLGHSKAATQVLPDRQMGCVAFVTPEETACAQPGRNTILSQFDNLPFQSRSIDVVVVHHALEQASDPRTVLRESSRILAPGGKLIVFGFNPWSLIGLKRGLASVMPHQLRQIRMINPIRLFDWLTLLGLELDAPPAYGGLTLFGDQQKRRSVVPSPSQLPFGGIVVTSAVKQQATMHFQWQAQPPRQKLAPVAYPRIASWQRNSRSRKDEI